MKTKHVVLLVVLLMGSNLFAQENHAASSEYPITVAEYCKFLNEAEATDSDSFYDERMECIVRVGAAGHYTYSGEEKASITFINQENAERYCDWFGSASTFNFDCCNVAIGHGTACDSQLRSNRSHFYDMQERDSLSQQSSGNENSWTERLGVVAGIAAAIVEMGEPLALMAEDFQQELSEARARSDATHDQIREAEAARERSSLSSESDRWDHINDTLERVSTSWLNVIEAMEQNNRGRATSWKEAAIQGEKVVEQLRQLLVLENELEDDSRDEQRKVTREAIERTTGMDIHLFHAELCLLHAQENTGRNQALADLYQNQAIQHQKSVQYIARVEAAEGEVIGTWDLKQAISAAGDSAAYLELAIEFFKKAAVAPIAGNQTVAIVWKELTEKYQEAADCYRQAAEACADGNEPAARRLNQAAKTIEGSIQQLSRIGSALEEEMRARSENKESEAIVWEAIARGCYEVMENDQEAQRSRNMLVASSLRTKAKDAEDRADDLSSSIAELAEIITDVDENQTARSLLKKETEVVFADAERTKTEEAWGIAGDKARAMVDACDEVMKAVRQRASSNQTATVSEKEEKALTLLREHASHEKYLWEKKWYFADNKKSFVLESKSWASYLAAVDTHLSSLAMDLEASNADIITAAKDLFRTRIASENDDAVVATLMSVLHNGNDNSAVQVLEVAQRTPWEEEANWVLRAVQERLSIHQLPHKVEAAVRAAAAFLNAEEAKTVEAWTKARNKALAAEAACDAIITTAQQRIQSTSSSAVAEEKRSVMTHAIEKALAQKTTWEKKREFAEVKIVSEGEAAADAAETALIIKNIFNVIQASAENAQTEARNAFLKAAVNKTEEAWGAAQDKAVVAIRACDKVIQDAQKMLAPVQISEVSQKEKKAIKAVTDAKELGQVQKADWEKQQALATDKILFIKMRSAWVSFSEAMTAYRNNPHATIAVVRASAFKAARTIHDIANSMTNDATDDASVGVRRAAYYVADAALLVTVVDDTAIAEAITHATEAAHCAAHTPFEDDANWAVHATQEVSDFAKLMRERTIAAEAAAKTSPKKKTWW